MHPNAIRTIGRCIAAFTAALTFVAWDMGIVALPLLVITCAVLALTLIVD